MKLIFAFGGVFTVIPVLFVVAIRPLKRDGASGRKIHWDREKRRGICPEFLSGCKISEKWSY